MKNIKSFKTFEGNENNKDEDSLLNDLTTLVNISREELRNDSINLDANLIDKFYNDLGDRKFIMYSKPVENTDFHTIYLKYDAVLFNLIYPAKNKLYCYYSIYLRTDDVVISTQPLTKTEQIMKDFSNKSLEKQVQHLTFVGRMFIKQKRIKF